MNTSDRFLLGICLMGVSVTSFGDHVKLVVIPPTHELNYSTPKSLLMSLGGGKVSANGVLEFASNAELSFQVGHTMIELECESHIIFQGGMSDRDSLEQEKLIKSGVGFGFAFIGTEGLIHRESGYNSTLDYIKANKVPHIEVTVQINTPNCRRLERYLNEFIEFRVFEHFGLAFRPLYKEGAGCSSFGVSFLDVAGVLEPSWTQQWQRTLNIPNEIIGDPDNGRKVDVMDIVNGHIGRRWAKESEDHRKLVFWEVQKMYDWARAFKSKTANTSPDRFSLYLDRTKTEASAGPIWKSDSLEN